MNCFATNSLADACGSFRQINELAFAFFADDESTRFSTFRKAGRKGVLKNIHQAVVGSRRKIRNSHGRSETNNMRNSRQAAPLLVPVGQLQGKMHQGHTNAPGCRMLMWSHLVILFCIFGVTRAADDWIDPDTPKAALVTEAYTVRPPPKPTPAPSINYDDDYYLDDDRWLDSRNSTKNGRRPKKLKPTKKPTEAPSAAPSLPTNEPSASPTSTPGAYQLVFSDEFNTPGRNFADGTDPRWTALDKNDYTNNAQHYYSPSNAYTNEDGELVIETEAADTDVIGYNDVKRKKTHVTKHFRSAMIQSWNKFCFTGGIIEAEVKMPGQATIGGLWPAFWILGNLARHTYVGSSEHIWPWSETKCTKKSKDSQRLSACHNVAHYGMKVGVGRGAPEIDIFEVQPGNVKHNEGPFYEMPVGQPFASSSYQVAPGLTSLRPGNGYWPGPGQWYSGLLGGVNSTLNIQFYGSYNHFPGDYDPAKSDYWSDALSFNQQLNESHFDRLHVYRLEWQVPTEERFGHLNWFLDGVQVLSINGISLFDEGLGKQHCLFCETVVHHFNLMHHCPLQELKSRQNLVTSSSILLFPRSGDFQKHAQQTAPAKSTIAILKISVRRAAFQKGFAK